MKENNVNTSKIKQEKIEEEIKKLNISLRERIKELTGLCSLAKLTDETDDIEEIFSKFVKEIVPPSIQFPERTIAKIEFDGKTYTNLEKTSKTIKKEGGLHAPIIVMGNQRGNLEVTYTEDYPFIVLFEQNLINSYAEWLGKIVERIEAFNEVTTTRDQLRMVINSASELIVAINKDGTIINWNNAISNLTGIQKRDLSRKSIYQDTYPEGIKPLINIIISSLKKGRNEVSQIQIKDKHNLTRTILCSISLITATNKEKEGIVLIGRDISSNLHLHKDITPGSAYLAYDKEFSYLTKSYESFRDNGYSFLYISRDITNLSQSKLIKDCKTMLLATKNKNIKTENRLDALLNYLKSFLNKKEKLFILIERLDYLCSIHGFENVIKFLYELNDLIRISNNILVLHISSKSFDLQQKSKLEDEFFIYPEIKQELPYLDSKKLDVLRFIASKNSFHHSVYYKMIRNNFSISKKLTKKLIMELEGEGLVRTEQNGRRKLVYVTDKAKDIVQVTV